MMRKRARSIQKGQPSEVGSDLYIQSDISLQRQKTSAFFKAPNSLLIGLTCMGVPDCDYYSLTSPTSPLDFKLFSSRFPKPSSDSGHHNKCWVCSKVGLGSIVDSLHQCDSHHVNDDGVSHHDNDDVKSNILFGSQIRSKTPCLPTNDSTVCKAPKRGCSSDVMFEIGGGGNKPEYSIGKVRSFSFDSKSLVSEMRRIEAFHHASDITRSNASSCSKLITSGQVEYGLGNHTLDPSEIQLSEDYTCVISHGPNPKTTHIFGDCVLGCHPNGIRCENNNNKIAKSDNDGTCCLEIPSPLPSTCLLMSDFLSHCNYCKNKLEEGKDIYMYRGEKAFCSGECRVEGISMEEQKEHSISKSLRDQLDVDSKTKDRNFDKSIFNLLPYI